MHVVNNLMVFILLSLFVFVRFLIFFLTLYWTVSYLEDQLIVYGSCQLIHSGILSLYVAMHTETEAKSLSSKESS